TIIEEKERRTLEFLFVTDLSSLEIVLGKLFARLAHVAMVLLTGLPVLALLQLLGGVDPNLLLMAFALTGLTMLSLGSLSILFSVLCKTGLSAVFDTYFLTGLYLVGSSCIHS